jgi:2'-5' RNA ligase
MRLFIAINLDDSIKEELLMIMSRLKKLSRQGSYTLAENLHLTLIFLGEIQESEINKIKAAMDDTKAAPFQLQFSGLGNFKRKEGDIYWVGVNRNKILDDIHRQLFNNLDQAGFHLEKRPFKPHLTIARRVITRQEFDMADFSQKILPMKMETSKISLMKSERINGKLTYTEIHAKHY